MSDSASAPPAPAAPQAVETEAPTRQKRERKQTAFLGAGDADDAPARKRVEFKPGRGTKLADIPNVAFRLSKISRKDDILKFIYRVLYKGVGKQMTIKKDIGEFYIVTVVTWVVRSPQFFENPNILICYFPSFLKRFRSNCFHFLGHPTYAAA